MWRDSIARPKRKFNARKIPSGKLHAMVAQTCKGIIVRGAGGQISKVNKGIIKAAAEKTGIPANLLQKHINQLKANNRPHA